MLICIDFTYARIPNKKRRKNVFVSFFLFYGRIFFVGKLILFLFRSKSVFVPPRSMLFALKHNSIDFVNMSGVNKR